MKINVHVKLIRVSSVPDIFNVIAKKCNHSTNQRSACQQPFYDDLTMSNKRLMLRHLETRACDTEVVRRADSCALIVDLSRHSVSGQLHFLTVTSDTPFDRQLPTPT